MSLVSSDPQPTEDDNFRTPQERAGVLILDFLVTRFGDAVWVLAEYADQLAERLTEAGYLVDEDTLAVLTYVSSGRGYVGVTPYPDSQARRALGRIRDE